MHQRVAEASARTGNGRIRHRRTIGIIAALLIGAWCALAPAARAGTTSKPYLATLSPASVAAGAQTSFTLTIRNDASQQQIGSANLTAPTGFVLVAGSASSSPGSANVNGNVVEIRGLALAPASTATVSFSATAPCAAGSAAWTIQVKQSNDFNGPPGNDFYLESGSSLTTTVSGSCHLNFVTGAGPADAVKNTTITTTKFNTPAGGPVQVEVLDGNNVRVPSTAAIALQIGPSSPDPEPGAVLSGGAAVNAVNGVASFSSLKISDHGNYNLLATSTGITSATSSDFLIWDAKADCAISCSTTLTEQNKQTSQVSSPSVSGFLLTSLGQDTVTCGDTYNHAPFVTTVSQYQLSATGDKTVVITIAKNVVQATPNNGAAFYRVCYQGETGDPYLLPNCSQSVSSPCVVSITKDKAGQVVETITLPSGDPKFC